MSDSVRSDLQAVEELERLLHSLGEEMTVLRRRAQQAEARVRELEVAIQSSGSVQGMTVNGDRHLDALERENELLRGRLKAARDRTRAILGRMRFLRQQHEAEVNR